ncbi:LOW QUALITY PROTEIN: mucin-17 [Bactrocera neohumeralis]|uniref:LOW QUALITY PROTEIN: mucin-17 n=1 Tax=Bactrocera neohumeralis TaxID=98809 RepID=UPI00216522E7|nr:LOW QUALITY PROTEIN: mucin-17 [Bactrocera neohumeralis]
MDEIEYLEEYEDLILPTMSTQTATTKGRNRTNLVTMPDDEDSSSIDQDIFDSLFDDNSDDESVMHKKGPAKLSQRSEHSSRYSRVSMDSLDMLVKELGEPFNPNADGSKSTNKPQPKQSNVKVTQPNKTVQKSTTTTTMAKGTNSPTPVSSVSMKTNKTEAAKTTVERNNKTKSVATVRPTVQQNLGQASASTKLINSNDNVLPTTRILQSNRSGGIQNAKITSDSGKVASPTPSTSRKQISAATSTTGSNSNSLNSSKHNTPMTGSKRIVERSQTTIIKPEKPQIKDPAEDPLSLENIENESESDTDSFIYSDVSADTFVTLSDVDYDERHIIELSNDSNYERANLDKIRGSTPSPTVSDDYKSDKEDTPTKMTSKFEENSKEGSVLEKNANVTSKFRVRQYVDAEVTTSRQRKQETPNISNDKLSNAEINSTSKDTLLERIDTVLSVANDKAEGLKFNTKHIDKVEPEDEVVIDSKDEAKDKTDNMPESAIACDSHVDGMPIVKPGVIQEPSTTETMEIDMGEIVEEDVEKEKSNLENKIKENTIEECKEMPDYDRSTNDAISVTANEKADDVVMQNLPTTENIDESVHQLEVISEQVVETMENVETNENLNTKQSDTECTANVCNEREVSERNANKLQEAAVAVESATNKTPNICNEDGVRNVVANVAPKKLADESKSESAIKTDGKNVKSQGDENEIEKDDTKALAEKDIDEENFELNTGEETNAELQLEKHEEQNEIIAAYATKQTEETEKSKKGEIKNESSSENSKPQKENEEDCATRSKNAKAAQETVKKMRGTDKQRVSLRRSQTPVSAKFTESKSQILTKKPTEKESKSTNDTKGTASKASDEANVEKVVDDVYITDAKKNATLVSKDGKSNEDIDSVNMKEVGKTSQSSRNKSNTQKTDNKIDDNSKSMSKSNIETDKTSSEIQYRKPRYEKKEEVLRAVSNSERSERSQTPRGRKIEKTPSEVAEPQSVGGKQEVGESEHSSTVKDVDEKKLIKEATAETQPKPEDMMCLEKCKTPELTPRHDKRVRGLVVSLKKTDLSKVLNEKLLRKINTQAKGERHTDLKESETAADVNMEKAKIDSKEQEMPTVTTKSRSKEPMPSDVKKKDSSVEKSAEERNKDLKVENTTEKAKEDIKYDNLKDKADISRRDEKSGDNSKRYSKYETPRSKSRRDRSTDKSVEKVSEHSKFMKVEDKAEHSSKEICNKANKDSRLEKIADDTKRYSKGEKIPERSKRESKYERFTERAKKESKEENPAEKLKTDSKDSTDRTKKTSKEGKSMSDRKCETEMKESKEKPEYKMRGDSKEERSKSSSKRSTERAKEGLNEGKSAEKTKTDSRESKEIPKKAPKEEKFYEKSKRDSTETFDDKCKRDSTDEKSVEKIKGESKDSTHRTNKGSNEAKSTRLSRYDKSIERSKKDSKDEKSEINVNKVSNQKRPSAEAKIESKHEKTADRSRKDSKEEKVRGYSIERSKKDEKSEIYATKVSNEKKTSEEAKNESNHEMFADRSRRVSKEEKARGVSKEEKTSTSTRVDYKETKNSEQSKSDSKKSTDKEEKDSKSKESETKATIISKEDKLTDKTIEDLEETQEVKAKSEDDKITDYRQLKWKTEKYIRKTKSTKDTKKVSESELNVEKESKIGTWEAKESNAPTVMETETGDKKTVGQNSALSEELNMESNADSTETETTQNCEEESESKLIASTIESRREDIEVIEEKGGANDNENTSQVEQNDNKGHTMSANVDKTQNERCESQKTNESKHEYQVNKETTEPTLSTKKAEKETAISGSTEKAEEITAAIENTDKSKKYGVVPNSASEKYVSRRGKFYKTREKKAEIKNEEESAEKEGPEAIAETKKEEESAEKGPEAKTVAENSEGTLEKKVEKEKEHKCSQKQEENNTEIVESNDVGKVETTTVAESVQKVLQATKVDENATKKRAKSRRVAENTQKQEITNVEVEVEEEITQNERKKTDTTIENKNVAESTDGKAATKVVGSTDKLENPNDTQTVDEIANENLNKEVVVEDAPVNADEIEHDQAKAGTLKETVNTTLDVNAKTQTADENANKNVDAESVNTTVKNDSSQTHGDEGDTENTDQSSKQEFSTQQTPTTKEKGAVESEKEPATGSGGSRTTKHNRIRNNADIKIISQSPQLQSADEDEHEGATRRSMRTRAADHSPSIKNETHKKGAKAANQTPISANATQKLQKEQPNSSRNVTATPTTNLTRKRMRDLTPNTLDENNEQEKSLSKKLKWESVRKSSRIHHDDVDTSEGEPDAAALAQRGIKSFSAKESPANMSAQEKQGKSTKSSKSTHESATNVATKYSTASEVKQSLTADNLKTSKTREKSINTSHSANKTHTPEVKRKQEHEKLPTTTTSTEPGKKRRAELENAQQSTKKLARANDESTQQQKNTTSKSTVKQAASTSTGTPTAVTRIDTKADHAHGSMATEDTDPLQLPVKRFKRLQAIDGYDTLNISEERKEIKAEELDNKNVTSKRKSLRAAGPTDSTKTAETAHKSTPKQQIQQQQQQKNQQLLQQQKQHPPQQQNKQQQQQQRAVPAKQVEATTTVSLKDRKIVVPNRTGEDAMSTDKGSSSKSPTKSPGSKVITFKEWLEQQKKSTSEDGGEEMLFEPDESAIRMDNIATATTTEPNRGNLSASEVSTVAEQKPNETAVVQTAVAEVNANKSSSKKMNVRDANKRKRQTEAESNATKEAVANELPKHTPPAAKHGRIEKVFTPAAAQFKRPSLPQRVSRLTPSRFNNRPSTQVDGRAGVHGTQQHPRKLTVQQLDTKVKLRKLRVRINRSTVAAYFKNFNLKVKEQVVENPAISSSHSVTDIRVSESEAKPTEPSQKRSPQKDPLAPAKKRIVSQPTTATTPLQLPTLTARPNVISAAEGNDALKSSPAAMPALTKVPPGVDQTSPTKSQENTDASQTEAADQQFGSTEELSLLTPMKCVTVPHSTHNSSRSQQQQQQQQQITSTAAEVMREKRSSTTSSSDASVIQRSQSTGKQTNSSSSSTITAASTASIANDTQLPFTPVVPKEEVVDGHTTPAQQAAAGITSGTSSDNAATTNSLASRTLAIAAATNSALNQTPTNDPSGYYGLTPTQLDSNGTRLYSFLHPAKYNRNHGCVLLDYCCPNLDGPMPAIDPTRIHAQVQAGVRELPAYIVMSTKLITRADLEANKNVIPASIRQKVEKITADATNTSVPTIASCAPNTAVANVTPVAPPVPVSNPTTSTTALTPTITALQKHLPSTTVITPKLMPSTSTPTMATPANATSQLPTVSDYQRSLLRTSIRQFDARLKKYYYRIAMLSFSERQTIIDSMINSTTLTPKDVDCAVRLIDEYAAQIGIATTTSTTNVTSPAIQSVSKAITTQTTNTVVRTTTIQQQSQKSNLQSSKTQVAVLDKDNSLLGYQLAASPMPMNKSSISTRSSIMSTSITGSMNTSLPTVSTTSSIVLPTLKATQASPRIFYTKPPMQTSTPIATTTSNVNTPLNDGKTTSLRSTPRMGRELTIRQIPQKLNSVPVSSSTATGTLPTRRLPTLTRNPHLSAGSSAEKSISETITTRSAVTISTAPKRMTRATAAAKVVVITQNTDGNSAPQDECILPDGHENTEIKREKVDDDFVGGN